MAERAPQGFFKCAIAVAPVSNFLYYGKYITYVQNPFLTEIGLDATYTERYMGNADDSVYNANDISRNVENFRKTRLLLVHGLYDGQEFLLQTSLQ
ncbi:unnamed protein product [Cylicostephanus goldi]|uniref:Peptidase S9 prolyl oligopeptidase catalytic domain-containing protein n=1 Tax=Cylicostephanus goldi TaxID=71465 RepID=A0A3P6T7N1_CYLGO|nr:unnamed protein product [Cylicostephanus goldi]